MSKVQQAERYEYGNLNSGIRYINKKLLELRGETYRYVSKGMRRVTLSHAPHPELLTVRKGGCL
jgi:hypothetical protein